MSGRRELGNDHLRVVVDLDRGAEVASITDSSTGIDVLMRTPWADRAERIRPSAEGPTSTSRERWTSSYVGGWQVLFPHAGPAAWVDGTDRAYHGEASTARWGLVSLTTTTLEAAVDLIRVPVRIVRTVSLDGPCVNVHDQLMSLSADPVRYVYVQHPAFGAPLIGPGTRIEAPDHAFRPVSSAGVEPQSDPLEVPERALGSRRFGTLEGLGEQRIRIVSPSTALVATVAWDDPDLAYVWLWVEAGASTDAWWGGEGYALALEPATTPADPADRRLLTLPPRETRDFRVTISIRPMEEDHG